MLAWYHVDYISLVSPYMTRAFKSKGVPSMETKARSWAKSIVWRVIGIFLLGGIAYAVTGRWEEVSMITLVFHSLRLVLYYFHERLWLRIEWGRLDHPLSRLRVSEKLGSDSHRVIEGKLGELGYVD